MHMTNEAKELKSQSPKVWRPVITPEHWRQAQAEQDEEELANASPILVVFPVGD